MCLSIDIIAVSMVLASRIQVRGVAGRSLRTRTAFVTGTVVSVHMKIYQLHILSEVYIDTSTFCICVR